MMQLSPGNNPFFAVKCLWQGVKLLNHPQLRKYLLIPLFINLVLYSGAFVLGYHFVAALLQQFIPDWLHWLNWILWPLFFVSFLLIVFFSFTLVANLIAAPYYSLLSAKVLQIINGQDHVIAAQPWNQVFFGELHRIGYILLRILPLLALFLVPVANLLAPLLWAVFAAKSIAMEFMAYPLESRGLPFPEQRQCLKQANLGMLSFGGITGIALTLPIINLFAGQAAVIGATIYVNDLSKSTITEANP